MSAPSALYLWIDMGVQPQSLAGATPVSWHSEDLGDCLRLDFSSAQQEVLLITPYVKEAAIRHVLAGVAPNVGVTLITALDLGALVTGATDIAASHFVANRTSGSVRVLPGLHSKIYSRDWMSWWAGSANLTNSGLQIEMQGNREVLAHFPGASADLSALVSQLLYVSRVMRIADLERLDTLLAPLKQQMPLLESHIDLQKMIWEELLPSAVAQYMVQELPLVTTPALLINALHAERPLTALEWHDCFLFALQRSDSEEQVLTKCALAFRQIPVIRELDKFLGTPRRFGEITAWLHERCENRPTPYRSEIKELAARVMDWCYQLYPTEYRRERPRHSELFGRTDGDWESGR